ncbi:MAG TPA: GyrI-like domain-containing protein [Nitrososphaerales archaeon]|nr:GyrI-like domain-containing protein [Nitrososphaerales archaeon]
MVVDFAIRKFSGCKVASVTYVGAYRGTDMMRDEFYKIIAWAREKGIRTGRWFFLEHDSPGMHGNKRKWEACVEIKDRARSGGGIRIRELPPQLVASIRFDPDKISPRVIYCGLSGWIEWRKKEKEYKEAGEAREVYTGDPWKSTRAWANTEIQVPVKKIS